MRRVEIKPLTGLRGAAAAWVVLFHVRAARPDQFDQALPFVRDWFNPVLSRGHLALDIFFVLSGFVLALNYLDHVGKKPDPGAMRQFWWARIARVWPAFFVMTSIAAIADIVVALLHSQPLPRGLTPISYLEQLLLVHLWTADGHRGYTGWNGPGWSISAEALAYLLFPLLALVAARITRIASARVLVVLAMMSLSPLALVMINTGSFSSPYSWILRIMCQFVAGMLMYAAVASVEWTPQRRRVADWACIGLVAAIVGWLYAMEDAALDSAWGLAFVFFPPLIALLSVASGPLSALLSRPWMVLAGATSFSLYLTHSPLFRLFAGVARKFEPIHAYPSLLVYLSLAIVPAAYVAGWLLWRWVEEPARKRIRAMADAPSRRPSSPGTQPQSTAPVA